MIKSCQEATKAELVNCLKYHGINQGSSLPNILNGIVARWHGTANRMKHKTIS